jgi:hypothetical protein
MVEPVTITPDQKKGLSGIRWSWRKLEEAKDSNEIKAVLAQVMQDANDDVLVTLAIPKEVYVRIMGNAKIAQYCGDLKEMGIDSYIFRAIQVYENNVKAIWVKRQI